MEQNGVKWTSSLLKGLGATSVAVPTTNPSSKVKQFAAALSLAAVAAMASFAPNVSHAADAPSAAPAPIELAATYIYPDGVEPEPQDDGSYLEFNPQESNPYASEYKIKDRDRDFIDTLNNTLNTAQVNGEKTAEEMASLPIFDNPVYKAYDAVTSPLDTLVGLTTDEGSKANEYAQKAADITNMAVKYSTVGAGALVSDGIKGVQAGVAKISEIRDKDHTAAQAAVDAARERMARIYDEERLKMAAADGHAKAPVVADRVDLQKAGGGGLETSNDGLENMFNAAPEKAGKYDHDKGLSR